MLPKEDVCPLYCTVLASTNAAGVPPAHNSNMRMRADHVVKVRDFKAQVTIPHGGARTWPFGNRPFFLDD